MAQTLRNALSNYLSKRSPQGLVGGPPYANNSNLQDKSDGTKLASRYVTTMDITGEKQQFSDAMLLASCDSTVTVGSLVAVSDFDKEREGPMVALAVPGTPSWPPVGTVKIKIADNIALVPVPGLGELPWSGAKPGDVYVTGTAGKMAKKGEAGYPAAGTKTLVSAIGIAPDLVMLVSFPYYEAV